MNDFPTDKIGRPVYAGGYIAYPSRPEGGPQVTAPRAYLCGACQNGRPADCSGWCGIVAPPPMLGPWTEEHWAEMAAFCECSVADLDPWADECGA